MFFVCRTLNNNNLTWLGKDMFSNMFRLRTLKLNDNLLHCDCQLSWLARWVFNQIKNSLLADSNTWFLICISVMIEKNLLCFDVSLINLTHTFMAYFRYLRHSPQLAQYAKCHSPNHLKGQSFVDLQEQDFKCSG